MRPSSSPLYPKPGPVGGLLIRKVIGFLKSQSIDIPISSHILIAVSGGCDSVALAHLLLHIGRRVGRADQISLLHINHRWRAEHSDLDEAFVKALGKRWGVPVIVRRLKPPAKNAGQSWEAEARAARKKVFLKLAQEKQAVVFTAHHADDLAETLLWRIFTGAAQTHGGGIAFHHGIELRPLLKIRKKELKAYLDEVKESYVEDATNFSDRFMRARMRVSLMPEAEKLFPKMVDHLVELALNAQDQMRNKDQEKDLSDRLDSYVVRDVLLQASGLQFRRPHFKWIEDCVAKKSPFSGEIHLPEGWKLKCEKKKLQTEKPLSGKWVGRQSVDKRGLPVERWVLERLKKGLE